MLKIKRTDVRKSRGLGGFAKAFLITIFFIFLFLIGFFAASYFKEILS